jgi:sortase A
MSVRSELGMQRHRYALSQARAARAAARATPARSESEEELWLGGEALVTLPAVNRVRARDWLARLQRVLATRRLVALFGGLLALGGFGQAGYIHAKAELAQVLMHGAWQRTLARGTPVRPWPWADTVPVARLMVPRLHVDQIVLSGASGRTLAFGPGWSSASARPGTAGGAIVSGHRDTHFAFLRELVVGDRVWLETETGRFAYSIERFDVVDSRDTRLSVAGDDARLSLVTCYPFDALTPGGPLRYVASARLDASAATHDSVAMR